MAIGPEAKRAIIHGTEQHEILLLALIRRGEITSAIQHARSGAPGYIVHQLVSECVVRGMRAEAEEFAALRTPPGLTQEESTLLKKIERSVPPTSI